MVDTDGVTEADVSVDEVTTTGLETEEACEKPKGFFYPMRDYQMFMEGKPKDKKHIPQTIIKRLKNFGEKNTRRTF